MRNRVAVLAAGTLLAAGLAAPALAGNARPDGPKQFTSTITPKTNVAPGTKIHVSSNGAMPNTGYYCVEIVLHGANYGPNYNSLKSVKSNAYGHVACTQTFKPFTVTDKQNKTRHCPTTAAERAAGFSCAISLADSSTAGQTSASVAKFTAHK